MRRRTARIRKTLEIEAGEVISFGLEYESFWYGSPEVEFYSYGFHSLRI